jgi:predicted dehydrogenase
MARIRFGIVGMGNRGIRTFGRHFRDDYADRADLVAVADKNPTRLRVAAERLGVDTTYESASALIADARVDVVVITSPDYTHADIALEAMAGGKHVICEKPIATTIDDCNRLLEAGKRFDKVFMIGFVLRYAAVFRTIHNAIVDGRIGRPLLADAIDNRPGAVYFRTWMRLRRYTGGLLNHKSGHTFDILNWMLDQRPLAVSAMGGMAVYTPKAWAGEFCSTCRVQEICPEYYDVNEGRLAGLFSAADRQPDTRTDLCVFNSEKDTVDHATVAIEYDGGARASYALCLFAPYSQRQLGVLGTGGKVEGREGEDHVRLSERSSYGPRQEVSVSSPRHPERLAVTAVADTGGVGGGHGGGDVGLLNDCFAVLAGDRDPVADLTAGYWSAVLGIAAEESVARGGVRLSLAELGAKAP